jgi:Leucine-rich repeat (LRR) protein
LYQLDNLVLNFIPKTGISPTLLKKLLIILFFSVSSLSLFAQVVNDTVYVYQSLQEALAKPDHVYKLNLSKKKLAAIPPEIFQLKNLRVLDLSRNRIVEIPKGIEALQNLQSLNLAFNKIEVLPDEIGKLTQLTYLGLNRNKIGELPPGIGNLENLETLELWDNELYKIPEEIGNLKKLKVLEIRGILFSPDEASRIDSLLPNTKILMSPTCNCKW